MSAAYSAAMWRYTLRDWHPDSGLTIEQWAQQLADEGWELFGGSGASVQINQRTVWRVSLRRWVDTTKRDANA